MKKISKGIIALAFASVLTTSTAYADTPFVGEVKSFGFGFCPVQWAALDGQLMSISSNDALFSLLGTTFGGDGRTTFGLPDMRGRVPVKSGTGVGLSVAWRDGQRSGLENVTANLSNLPNHTHSIAGSLNAQLAGDSDAPDTHNPSGGYLGSFTQGEIYTDTLTQPVQMATNDIIIDESSIVVGQTGGQNATNNMAPYGVTKYCIALFGIYPSRN